MVSPHSPSRDPRKYRRTVGAGAALALTAGLALTAAPSTANADHRERASGTLRLADGRTVGQVGFFGNAWTATESG